MPVYVGRGGVIVAKGESAWGTAVSLSGAASFRTYGFTFEREIDRIAREALNEAATPSVSASFHDRSDFAMGSGEIQLGYEGGGLWLKHWMWGVAESGSGPYTHALTLGSAPPTGGLTVGANLGTGSAEVFEGGRIDNGELTIEAGDYMRFRPDLIFETSAGRVSALTPTYTTNELPILFHHAGSVTWNSLTLTVYRMTIRLKNNFERRLALGSKLTLEPNFKLRVPEIELECEYDSGSGDGIETGYLAGTQSSLAVTFSNGTQSLAVTLQNAAIMRRKLNVQGHGVLRQQLTFRGFGVSTNYGLIASLINSQAAIDTV